MNDAVDLAAYYGAIDCPVVDVMTVVACVLADAGLELGAAVRLSVAVHRGLGDAGLIVRQIGDDPAG